MATLLKKWLPPQIVAASEKSTRYGHLEKKYSNSVWVLDGLAHLNLMRFLQKKHRENGGFTEKTRPKR